VSQGPRRNEASSIVRSNEFSKSQPQVPLVEGDEIVQALPSDGPDQSFSEGSVKSSEGEKIESRS
jgi:hypothetical protein